VELHRDGPGALAVELSTDWIGAAVIGLGGTVYDPTIFPPTRRSGSLRTQPIPVVHMLHGGAGIVRPKEVEAQ
jgi:hypothetical protein